MFTSPLKRRIWASLCSHPRGIPLRELVEKVYRGKAGGPLWARNSVMVTIHNMRRQLRITYPLLVIKSGTNRHGYRIFIRRPPIPSAE